MKSFIWEAWQLVGSSGFGWTGATNENIKWITSKSFIEEAIKNHNLRLFVSKIGDEIVAFCAIRRIDVGSIDARASFAILKLNLKEK